MEILKDYLFEKDKDGYILVIYVRPENSEFSKELFDSTKETSRDLKEWLVIWAKKQGPKVKIHTVRIMLGTFLLISIPIPSSVEDRIQNPIHTNQVFAQTNTRFNMSYLYFGSPSTHVERVLRTNNSVNIVSPSYFDLDDDGNLKITSLLSSNFIKEMHANGIRVVPFLSNHWDREKGIKALKNRDQLVDDIIDAIETYDLDGINIDIENVTPEQKNMYTDLVKQLRQGLPADKEVSVAVAANPYGWTGGWHGSYDYHELGKYADYLMIMAYDESFYGSKPGPVASHNFVEASIQYALKYVPASKIVLGISFYGRYWNEELGIAGNGIHLTKIKEIMETYETKVTYYENYQAPKVEFTVKKGDPLVYVFNDPLKPGTYTIWYENNDSIKDKLMLVQKYNLKGTGNWSLGQEVSEIWSYYSLWLNGKYFEDINDSWAKDDILAVAEKKLMKGISETKFAPNDILTRAQAATLMARVLKLEDSDVENTVFKDVPTSHWAKDSIHLVAEHGIMKGMGNELFSPDEPLTREQMAMILYRILQQEPSSSPGKPSFSDVDSERWSAKAIYSMTEKGLYEGYPDNTFRPAKAMTRQEMAALMNRITKENIFPQENGSNSY